jgi:hypothetical protein
LEASPLNSLFPALPVLPTSIQQPSEQSPSEPGRLWLHSFLRTAAWILCLSCAVHWVAANPPGTIHYPDLQNLAPSDVGIDYDPATGQKLLRFTISIANLGQGPLEVAPVNNPATGTTDAYQRLYSHDSQGKWYLVSSNYVGTFDFHPEHNHWHFDNFARYELRNVAPDGSVGGTVLASNQKVSFCIRDDLLVNGSLLHAGAMTYTNCDQIRPQGITVGWADVYPWTLPDQNLDITGIPDGDYWLVSTADPLNLLNEGAGALEDNNTGSVKVHITSDVVWFDDAVPAGAATGGYNGDTWKWVSSNPAPFSGSRAHQSATKSGSHQHYFYGATATLGITTNSTLYTYVYLDPANLPSEIMLQWGDGDSWEHRAYWGANSLSFGVNGTASRRFMGPLPPAGRWVRLEVAASLVGLEGIAPGGMSFTLFNGRATWDKTGIVYPAPSSPPPPPVDTTPPTVAITSPSNGALVSGTITVTANASDNVGVTGVQFKLDGANLGVEDTATPYAVSWNTSSSANGSHTLTAVARDAAGNKSVSGQVTVTVNNGNPADTTPPAVAITSPSSGALLSGAVSVAANASDNVAVAGVQFKLDGANLGTEVMTPPYAVSWNTTSSSNGSHTLTAVARDAAGNQTVSSPVIVTVNNGGTQATVWLDDSVPAGAWTGADGGDSAQWLWVTSNPAPFSGARAHQSGLASGIHQHYFSQASATLPVNPGDTLFTYVFLDPANPPREIMLQWFDGSSWAHAAYWGENLIPWGADGTSSQRPMGALPTAGQWVRLQIPASLVGLEGRTLSGMSFILYNGRATWDTTGK